MAVTVVLQVIEDGGVLLRAGNAQVIQGLESDDPRGDGGAEVFAEEGPQGNVFPLLDVACGPIVEEHEAEDVILRLGCCDALAEWLAFERDEGHFELEVNEAGRAKDGRGFGVRPGLAHGAAQRRAADDDA